MGRVSTEVKEERKKIILEALKTERITVQDELKKVLKNKYQLSIEQSTISKYLTELAKAKKVIRDNEGGYRLYSEIQKEKHTMELAQKLRKANIESDFDLCCISGLIKDYSPIVAKSIQDIYNDEVVATFTSTNAVLVVAKKVDSSDNPDKEPLSVRLASLTKKK